MKTLTKTLIVNTKLLYTYIILSPPSIMRNCACKGLNSDCGVIVVARAKYFKESFCKVLNSGLDIRVNKHRCRSFTFVLIALI